MPVGGFAGAEGELAFMKGEPRVGGGEPAFSNGWSFFPMAMVVNTISRDEAGFIFMSEEIFDVVNERDADA